MINDAGRAAFVRANTELTTVPLVPELRVFTATAVTPLWSATARWLDDRAVTIPFWSAPWAGGQALARYVLDHPACVRGLRVVDFGCGGGLVALAAVLAGAAQVRALDIDPLACVAAKLNAEANGLTLEVEAADVSGEPLPEVDVLLAGDIWYEPGPAARFDGWLRELAAGGIRVLTADPGRAYAPQGLELARYQVPTPVELESAESLIARVLELVP